VRVLAAMSDASCMKSRGEGTDAEGIFGMAEGPAMKGESVGMRGIGDEM